MFNYQLTQLKSGLTLIKVPMEQTASLSCLALCNTGSRYESKKDEGLAHFFEHMVAKGTDKYPTAQILSRAIDGIGADFNAFTGKEYTGYYVKAASHHFELVLDVVSDMLLTPRLRQEDIDREMGVIVEELNMYRDMPARHIAELFEEMIFSDQGLAHDIAGNKGTVRSFKTADFQRLLNEWYGLENLIVIVAGDANLLKKKDIDNLVGEMFAKTDQISKRKGKRDLRKWLAGNPISKHLLHLESKQTEQAHFILGWPGIKRQDKRRYSLNLLSTVLGGNMSSRLFTEVREMRGLCYYVHSDMDLYHDTGVFGASAGVDPGRVEEAIKVTANEFHKIKQSKTAVTDQELRRAKDYVAGKMVLGLEDSLSVAQYFGMRQLLHGKIETPEQVLAQIEAVTLDEVNQVAHDLIKDGEMRLALIGPYKDEGKFRSLLV